MKKPLLLLLIFLSFISFTRAQNLYKVPEPRQKHQEKININPETSTGIPAADFLESFESSNFPPANWTAVTNGGSGWSRQLAGNDVPGWGGTDLISTPAGGGSAVAYCTYSDGPFFNDQWLITPLILDIQPTDTLFFYLRNQVEIEDSIYIYYSTDGTNFNIIGNVFYNGTSGTDWQKWFIHIGAVVTQGSNVFIGFREFLFDNLDFGGAISLDLVSVSGAAYPAQINLQHTFSFGDVSQGSSYRMIGLPGNINRSVIPSGEQKRDWNIFYDNGTVSENPADYLVEFNSQALFNFLPGKGFWALSRNPIAVGPEQVNTVPLSSGGFFIPLHEGFNIISNPFEINVSVDEIRITNGLPANAVFHSFNGTFTAANTLVPYEGYYFNNEPSFDLFGSLYIPYFSFTSPDNPPSGGKITAVNSAQLTTQHLKICLNQDQQKKEVTAGIDRTASNDFDEMDYFSPPDFFEDISINLYNNNLSTNYKNLSVEYRPEIGEGQIFNFRIKNKTGDKLILYTEGLENFSDYEIYIIDERVDKLINLRDQNFIEISHLHETNNYSLLIGKPGFINSKKDELIPKEFALFQNYPNPFNPSTVIRYAIPGETSPGAGGTTEVLLTVYDILGNEVAELVNEKQSPGIYETEFNGSSLSSGIYFIKINAGNFKETKKMTLIK